MAERNDVNIKVGVTGAKKALDELTKVLESYSKSEKAAQKLAHQAELNQLKVKEANSERLHNGRMLKEAERLRQAINNSKIESAQLTNRMNMIKQAAATEAALAEQAAKSHKARNAQIQSDLSLQHATQRAILATTTATAEATARQEIATQRVVKAEQDVLRVTERAGAATASREAAEVRLQSTLEKSASQARQNLTKEQTQVQALNNSRIRGENEVSREARRLQAFNSQEERRDRAEALRQRLADIRIAATAENQARAQQREEDRRADRERRQQRQNQGFFGDLLGPQVGRVVEDLGRLNLAFMIVTNAIRPFTDALAFSVDAFARYEVASIGFATQLTNMGQSVAEGNRVVREFNDGISDPTAVMRAVQMMAPMNLSYQKQIELINSIRDGIVSMGGDVNEQLPLMVLAIRRGSSELLDNMGVTKNADEVYKEFAKSIGKKVSELRDDQKQMALVNAVIKENSRVSGLARQSADTLTGSMNRLQTTARELGTNIGSYLAPGVQDAINLFDRLAAAAARAIPRRESAIETLRRAYPTREAARTALTNAQAMVTGTQERLTQRRNELRDLERRLNEAYEGNELGRTQAITLYHGADLGRLREEIRALEAGLETATNTRLEVGRLMAEYTTADQARLRQEYERLPSIFKPAKTEEEIEKERKAAEKARNAAEREARKAQSEAERREREAAKRRKALLEKEYREGVARGQVFSRMAGPRFGAFSAKYIESAPGATLAQQQQDAMTNLNRARAAEGANIVQLNKVIAEQGRVTVLPKQAIEQMKKDREALEKAIKDGQADIAKNQQRLDEINFNIQKQRIQDTADFLESSYQVALQVLQGDFTAAFSVIGNVLKDSIVKALSESAAVQAFVTGITTSFASVAGTIATALTGALTTAFTAIGAILTGPFAPLIIAVGALGALIWKTMSDASERAKKYADDIANLREGIDKLLPKNEPTIREQRQQKIGELETRRADLLARLEKERKGTKFSRRGGDYIQRDEPAIKRLEGELGVIDDGIRNLGNALDNDLSDPLSAAAIAAKKAADAIEEMTKRSESFAKVSKLNSDLEDKIFNQTIDRLVAEGKITKEEGDKRKMTQDIIRERSDMVSQAYEESRGFMFGGGIGMSKGTFEAAFGKFRQGDMAGTSAMLASIGITENESANVIQLFKNIEKYLTGKGQEANMPGSSPDKPMYTQVVNVRDFREAFPDSAYFRTGGPMMNATASAPVNSNTATSRSSSTSGPVRRFGSGGSTRANYA